VLPSIVVVEISLQLHQSLFCGLAVISIEVWLKIGSDGKLSIQYKWVSSFLGWGSSLLHKTFKLTSLRGSCGGGPFSVLGSRVKLDPSMGMVFDLGFW
jgi:hypothetical protein